MLWECFQYDICRVRLDEEGFEHWGSSLAVKINRIWEKDSDIVYNYSTHSIGFIYCKPFTSNATNGEIRDYSLKEEKKRYNVMCDFKSRITIVYKNADKLSELVDKKK